MKQQQNFWTIFLSIALSIVTCFIVDKQLSQAISINKISQNAKQTQEKPLFRDKWALCIGINRFSDEKIESQKFAQKSAGDLARCFKDQDSGRFALDHVLVVTGKDASQKGIENAFEGWLLKKALPNDIVIVYFNTHLTYDQTGDPYLCASDTQLSNINQTGINLFELLHNLKIRTGSKNAICLIDCSPTTEEKTFLSTNKDLKWLASNGVTILSASKPGETSLNNEQAMRTCFANYFIETIKGTNGGSPLAVVAEYIFQKLKEDSLTHDRQTPVLSLVDGSQVALIPLGLPSQIQNHSLSIGYKLDEIAFKRPDMIIPDQSDEENQFSQSNLQMPKSSLPVTSNDDEKEDFDPKLDFGPYMAYMKEAIQKYWQPPKGFESRHVAVVFTILKDGTITNASLVKTSGNQALDNSALKALEQASPLNPLPAGSPKQVDIRYTFDWKMQNAAK